MTIMKRRKALRATAYAVAVLALAVNAHAGVVTGSVWLYTASPENFNPLDASVAPTGAPDAQFYTTDINYDTRITGSELAAFLGNPTFFNTSGTWNPSYNVQYYVYMEFTGSVHLNSGDNSFSVLHDDGAILTFPALNGGSPVVNKPDQSAPTESPFTVTAPSGGEYSFVLDYTECCSLPAVLEWTINGDPVGVPEPGSFQLILGALMVGIGGLYRKLA
jgi:hypothetical protein